MIDRNRKNIKLLNWQLSDLIVRRGNLELTEEKLLEIDDNIGILIGYRERLYDEPRQHPILIAVTSGFFGLLGIGLVLYYEKTDIITSKAFNIGTRMIGA